MTNSIRNGTAAFMTGLGFGAGLALLFAPRSGVRTRVLLARKTRKGTDLIKRRTTSAWNSASNLFAKGQKEAAQHKEGLKRAIEIGKRTYRQSVG